jgi:steroid delta-isomerase-like uncharacterized protein
MDLDAVIARYDDAWNRHDVDAILALHTEDSVFENHTGGGRGVGKDGIRPIIAGVFRSFPDVRFELRRLYVREALVVQEWTAFATHSRPLLQSGVRIPPTGKAVSWNGVDVMPMRGGLVARKDVYVDSIGLARQLGLTR